MKEKLITESGNMEGGIGLESVFTSNLFSHPPHKVAIYSVYCARNYSYKWGLVTVHPVYRMGDVKCIGDGNGVTSSIYRIADKSLVRPTSRCVLVDGENISFDTSLVIYKHSTRWFKYDRD